MEYTQSNDNWLNPSFDAQDIQLLPPCDLLGTVHPSQCASCQFESCHQAKKTEIGALGESGDLSQSGNEWLPQFFYGH